MSEFLLEILAEEIPAGVLPGAREDLLARVSNAFAEARLGGTLTVHSTSRRLILVGEGVAERQPDATLEVTGPPASRGFDAEGKPTQAAEGFAKAQGVSVDDLSVVQLPKGPYVVAKKTVPGRPASEVIAEILPPLVEKMTFPRMMRWGDGGPIWIRPVHSVVALLDGLVIPLASLRRRERPHDVRPPHARGRPDHRDGRRGLVREAAGRPRRARPRRAPRALRGAGEGARGGDRRRAGRGRVALRGVVPSRRVAGPRARRVRRGVPRAARRDPRDVDARAPEDAPDPRATGRSCPRSSRSATRRATRRGSSRRATSGSRRRGSPTRASSGTTTARRSSKTASRASGASSSRRRSATTSGRRAACRTSPSASRRACRSPTRRRSSARRAS